MYSSTQHRLGLAVVLLLSFILVVEFSAQPVNRGGLAANQRSASLRLTKNSRTVQIDEGTWLVAVGRYSKVLGRGQLVYAEVDSSNQGALALKNKDEVHIIPTEKIVTLWQGHAREVGTKVKRFGLTGLVLGSVVGLAMFSQDDFYVGVGLIPLCAGIDGAALGTLGALSGLVQQGFATAYALGPHAWSLSIPHADTLRNIEIPDKP